MSKSKLMGLRTLFAASSFVALAGIPRVMAQEANASKSASASADSSDDQAIELSPFTVSADTEGYQAVDTLGGARVKTKLADTPSSISVITKSLLDDSGITNAQQLLVYTTDTEVAGLNGNYSGVSSRGVGVGGNAEAGRLLNPNSVNRARGLTAMDNTRNYFTSEIPWDSFNIERVDISRGPNSFLFGVGSPSGISNYSTNQAEFHDKGSLEFRVGSWGSTRESLDYNKVLVPGELAMRVDLLNDDTEYRQKPAFNHSERAYAALRYDPKALKTDSSHMTISANAEAGRVRSNNPRELPPMDFISGYFAGFGLNKAGYDPFVYNTNQQLAGVGSFKGLSPYINAQDYHYAWPGPTAAYWYDGTNGSLLQAMTTFNGAPSVAGGGVSIGGFPQAAPLYTTGWANYAMAVNSVNPNTYPGAYAGTVVYNNKSLTDPSIFNFYDHLIDGPNKQEWQNWRSFNLTVEESMLNGRLSFQGVMDHQEFDQGQVGALMGYTEPYISVDMDAYKIMYPSWLPGGLAVANPNVGRPFVAGDFGGGDNSSKFIHDNYQLLVNGDLEAQDFLGNTSLAKILGTHSLTGLLAQYKTRIDDRTWSEYATDPAFGVTMGDPAGILTSRRTVQWVSYLGSSLTNVTSPTGLNLSGIQSLIAPASGTITNFDNTYTGTVSSTAPWTNPSPYATGTYTQADNPANYKGFTTIPVTVLNWQNNINQLYQSGSKTQQVLDSAAFMYQGHMFDDMVIPEFGWRRDSVRQTSSNAPLDPNTHVASMNYSITGDGVKVDTTSNSYGITLHLPKSIRGKLPLGTDLSLYYFHGNNETPKVRYAFDTSQLPNETGKTDDYGVQVDTLNGHATLRVTFFKTLDKNAQAGSGAADPLGNNGYYLYLLPAWIAGDAAANAIGVSGGSPGNSWFWNWANNQGAPGVGYGDSSSAAFQNAPQTIAEKAAIASLQSSFAQYFPQQFFDAYGLGVNVGAITAGNWASVFNNTNTYPFPWVVANTGGGKINGSFPIISQDIQSKGVEIEATIRPVNNWNLTFNISKVDATQVALGSADSAFIQKEYTFFKSTAGNLYLWGSGNTVYQYFMQNIWSAYQLQSAQTGASQPELSNWNMKGLTNYRFEHGFLKGFNVGGGLRWASKPILGYGISQVTDPTGATSWIMDVKKPIYGKIDEHADFWMGYERKLTDNVTWKIQLNIQNLGEHPHLVPVSVEPDGTWAQQRIEVGQQFTLTNTFKF